MVCELGDMLLSTFDDVEQENGAILTVEMKCKGAAGTVTINPNGNGGVTTCTCPDPQDATRDTVTCIEIYARKTTVMSTPAAMTGQLDKWKGVCAGNPAACSLTLDPARRIPTITRRRSSRLPTAGPPPARASTASRPTTKQTCRPRYEDE